MNKKSELNEFIGDIIKTIDLAVLATEGDGQPHASLIKISPFKGSNHLVFATYRNTLKYRNIQNNNKVAVLIESCVINNKGLKKNVVLTIIGYTEEVSFAENEAAYQAHLKQNPELELFMLSPDCTLLKVIAQSYQVVYGIDEIKWISADELYSS
jgi:uncharacterized pyridoxamine 5'-phosphate oxidase family protein